MSRRKVRRWFYEPCQSYSFSSIEQVTDQFLTTKNQKNLEKSSEISFAEILKEKQGLKFSKHAAMRLENRNINLTDEQNNRLRSGVQKASEKGINESLVIVDSLAFIVNVPNKTVVTAMDQKEAADNIFTNIDGAVII